MVLMPKRFGTYSGIQPYLSIIRKKAKRNFKSSVAQSLEGFLMNDISVVSSSIW
jgi:hypothetical protein